LPATNVTATLVINPATPLAERLRQIVSLQRRLREFAVVLRDFLEVRLLGQRLHALHRADGLDHDGPAPHMNRGPWQAFRPRASGARLRRRGRAT